MGQPNNFTAEAIAKKATEFCLSTGRKFIFLSGNGGSGKTELSKLIFNEAAKHGHANIIDLDDFVVDTTLRNSALVSWHDREKGPQNGRYTTAFAASYFLQNVKAILYNIEKGNNYYHWPKKATKPNECRLLYGDALITIVEGIGTVFLEKDKANSLSIFMQCSQELEVARRIARKRSSNEKDADEVRKNIDERTSQYKAIIQPYSADYAVMLESLEDFSLNVLRDDAGLFA